jgi:hypothetical protein
MPEAGVVSRKVRGARRRISGIRVTFDAIPGLIVRAVPRAERGSALGAAQVARYLGYSLGSAAIQTASAAAFLAGTAVAGAGVGTGFFAGAYRVLTALASPG